MFVGEIIEDLKLCLFFSLWSHCSLGREVLFSFSFLFSSSFLFYFIFYQTKANFSTPKKFFYCDLNKSWVTRYSKAILNAREGLSEMLNQWLVEVEHNMDRTSELILFNRLDTVLRACLPSDSPVTWSPCPFQLDGPSLHLTSAGFIAADHLGRS